MIQDWKTEDLPIGAKTILNVFRERGLKAGASIHHADFGDAIVWEAGNVRDPEVRQGWDDITAKGYVTEDGDALELTLKGQQFLYGDVLAKPLKVENVQDALFAVLDVIDRLRGDLETLGKVVSNAGIDAPSFRAAVELSERSRAEAPFYTNELRNCIKGLEAPKSYRAS